MENINISRKNTPNTGLKIASLSLAVMLMAGCGSADDPDDGSPISTTSVSGAAIDGYLAGATVYADLNEDGRKNAGEPSALTDSDGYFTTSKDDEDYCASSATKQYCLRIKGSVPDEVVIRARGGFDVFTNEPFTGEVSAKVSPLPDGSIPDQMITPVTSVLADADDTTTTSLLATLFGSGTTSDKINKDFLDTNFDAEVANRAYLLHKIAVIYADTFEEAYEFFGEESFFPDSATVLIYEALADALGGESDLSNLNQAFLEEVFNAVDQRIVDTYNEEKDEDDSSISSQTNGSAAVANALSVIGLVNTAIPDSGLTVDKVRARMMGVDMVVSKMTSGAPDADIAAALQEALDTSEALGTLYDALGDGSEIDFRALLGIDYSQAFDYSEINVSGGILFAEDLANSELYIEYDDGEANVDGAALLLFAADGEQTSRGDFKLCIRYQDNSGEDTDLNTEGALFDVGEWNIISNRALVLRVLGGFNFSVTSKGEADTGENLLNFSYSGDSETWATDSDLADLSSSSQAMETNADCKARLTELDGSDTPT